jgi:hypothetical protein
VESWMNYAMDASVDHKRVALLSEEAATSLDRTGWPPDTIFVVLTTVDWSYLENSQFCRWIRSLTPEFLGVPLSDARVIIGYDS